MEIPTWVPDPCQTDPCPFLLKAKRTAVLPDKCDTCGATAPVKPRTFSGSVPPITGRDRTARPTSSPSRSTPEAP